MAVSKTGYTPAQPGAIHGGTNGAAQTKGGATSYPIPQRPRLYLSNNLLAQQHKSTQKVHPGRGYGAAPLVIESHHHSQTRPHSGKNVDKMNANRKKISKKNFRFFLKTKNNPAQALSFLQTVQIIWRLAAHAGRTNS
jgi:hypothetical protein